MATSEALIKYYDCLKDSFSKIQDKDNKTALINAALRPKIREEFSKSEKVLDSYLEYIQVFSLIYCDKFVTICSNIIVPLLKENEINSITCLDTEPQDNGDIATKIHKTVRAIIHSKPELANDFVLSVVKVFPNIDSIVEDEGKAFLTYLKNCLKICTYLKGELLINLLNKIVEKLNPSCSELKEQEGEQTKKVLESSYALLYEFVSEINEDQLDKFGKTFLTVFAREFLTTPTIDQFNYFILYLCSLKDDFPEFLINLLWSTFIDSSKSLDERRASVKFACSLISRASYIGLDKVFDYLETAKKWCIEFLDTHVDTVQKEVCINESKECFFTLAQSMFYLITQRYREMYEEESLAKLVKLNLDQIIETSLNPLSVCDKEIEQRFREVAILYNISRSTPNPPSKRRKSDQDSRKPYDRWDVPFRETIATLPERIRPLFRTYYNHRNFTIYRE